MSRTCFTDIKDLYGCSSEPVTIKKGKNMNALEHISNAFLLIENEEILSFGPMNECPEAADRFISIKGQSILPAWCDSHTHLVWAGSRQGEFVDRLKGLSYEEIAANGGGILNSASLLRSTSEQKLYENAQGRLEEVIRLGTGAIEIKSGYGLSVEAELKMLRVIKLLKEKNHIPIRATFLGAHAIPTEYKKNRQAYIQLITEEMIPRVADEGLADYCDVFCDKGFFTVDETRLILETAHKYGLPPKIHANELDFSGGVQIGVEQKAISVDHLECTGEEEIDLLLKSTTIPTLLPGTAFFLNIPYPPARKMIDKGLGVALATDYNPGSTPSGRMTFILSLACLKMKMLPNEAINASTINGAYALEWSDRLGSISPGKYANFIITKPIPDVAYIPYAYGSDHIDQVYIKGLPS